MTEPSGPPDPQRPAPPTGHPQHDYPHQGQPSPGQPTPGGYPTPTGYPQQPGHQPTVYPQQGQPPAGYAQQPGHQPTGYPERPQGYQQPGQPFQPPPGSPSPAATNPGAGMGWLGTGLGLLVGFVGIVLGAISISRSGRAGASRVPGTVAVVVGSLQVVVVVTTVLVLVFRGTFGPVTLNENPGDTDTETEISAADLAPGNCLEAFEDLTSSYSQVPCADPHGAEVIHTYEPDGNAYPGEDAIIEEADEVCLDEVALRVPVGVDTTDLYYNGWYPGPQEWDDGDRTVACVLIGDGVDLTGSAIAGDLTVG